MNRFALRYDDSIVPTVVVSVVTIARATPTKVEYHHHPVRKVRGITQQHAMIRAQRWTREHGDPR
jgi:hypothetical protein